MQLSSQVVILLLSKMKYQLHQLEQAGAGPVLGALPAVQEGLPEIHPVHPRPGQEAGQELLLQLSEGERAPSTARLPFACGAPEASAGVEGYT